MLIESCANFCASLCYILMSILYGGGALKFPSRIISEGVFNACNLCSLLEYLRFFYRMYALIRVVCLLGPVLIINACNIYVCLLV